MSAGTPPLSGQPPKPQVKGLNCPKCGAAITLRCFGQAETVVCGSCRCILDAKDPNLAILQQFEKLTSDTTPLIPLGTRGKLRGTDYEVIGFQRRHATVEGVPYPWHEYVLFNPYKGFRYLSEYNGHWNDISICKDLPVLGAGMLAGSDATPNYLGEVYRHFQTSDANTDFVLGEFPWQVRVGEHAEVTDYVHPPRVLSCEKMDKETTWSIGEYMYGREIWDAFKLPGSPPEAQGVYENQPSTVSTNVAQIWAAFGLFAILLFVLMVGFEMFARKEPVFDQTFHWDRAEAKGEPSFVTDVFDLNGRTSSVQVKTSAPVSNHWIYLNYALINQDTGEAWDFGREVSYYFGYDSDGSWTEGKQEDTVVIPSVPAGHYYLRIEPEVDPALPDISYTVDVTRDVHPMGIYGLAFLTLLIPALMISWRSYAFERSRWSESDHPPLQLSGLSGSSEDD
ncbi:MAG TPA: DUF4178 domain-containing protein [Candidatus Angelobacter sp.]|nr:DUF4178 domain-containing protein [Candidatus Angelobacter sp.]